MNKEDDRNMKEIKVLVFNGDIAQLTQSSFSDTVVGDQFTQTKGYTVQQFHYQCCLHRDTMGTVHGQTENVLLDFTIRMMDNDQMVFYEKLGELSADLYSFVFNAVFDGGQLKNYDNAIMVDGFVVDVEEAGSNDDRQATMHVRLLARELHYIHKGSANLVLNISKEK